ncbi:hypothetical protein BHM03_00010417, partial [Ensete ventricosum]
MRCEQKAKLHQVGGGGHSVCAVSTVTVFRISAGLLCINVFTVYDPTPNGGLNPGAAEPLSSSSSFFFFFFFFFFFLYSYRHRYRMNDGWWVLGEDKVGCFAWVGGPLFVSEGQK